MALKSGFGSSQTCTCEGVAGDVGVIDSRCADLMGCKVVLENETSWHVEMMGCVKCANATAVCWSSSSAMTACANMERMADPSGGQMRGDNGKITCSSSPGAALTGLLSLTSVMFVAMMLA